VRLTGENKTKQTSTANSSLDIQRDKGVLPNGKKSSYTMSETEFLVDSENGSPRPFEVPRFSYQIDTTGHYMPGSGSRVVDFNGEELGAAHGVRAADRYRLALTHAMFDGGVRALCTSGRRCNTITQCGFCRTSGLRPVPEDGYEQFPSAVAQARFLWSVSLQELAPRVAFGEGVSTSSFGAMLLAAHVQGHNCISVAFDGMFPENVPHEINTLVGVVSWAKASKFRLDKTNSNVRSLLIVRIAPDEEGAHMVTHAFSIPKSICLPFNETTVSLCGYTISAQALSYDRALQARTLSVVVDVGYNNPVQSECITHSCNSMPLGYTFCRACGCTVKVDGHTERCRPSGPTVTMELVYARAQFGDLLHTQDVLHALVDRRVPSSERTLRLAEYQSASSQAAFMRFAGYDGLDSVLSTWFEASYDYFRSYYWEVTFESAPPFPIILISDLHPERLDPRPLAEMSIAPDYRSAWSHILKVSNPVGSRVLVDDPVKVAVRESRSGRFESKVEYTQRFTKLPPPTRLCIQPISGTKVYDNNAFLEVTRINNAVLYEPFTPSV